LSTDTQFRIGQIGTQINLIFEEIDPADETKTVIVDLTNKDSIGIEFRRSNKTTFLFVDKAGDPNLVPAPSTLVVSGAPTLGKILFTDNIGIFNIRGRWAYRGVYRENISGVIVNFPGSWTEREVGI